MWPFRRKPAPVPAPPPAAAPEPKPGMRMSPLAAAILSRLDAPLMLNPFVLPAYPKGVLPGGREKMAMDAGVQTVLDFGALAHSTFAEGIGFMGYGYLAQLSQRPEYRRPVEVIAEEMTREWITLRAAGDGDKTDKIAALEDALKQHRVRELFRDAAEMDGFFGRAQIFIDLGDPRPSPELSTPLAMSKVKIGKGTLKGFRLVDPMWTAPSRYNSSDPLAADFFVPQSWYVMGSEIHASRLLTMIARPMPLMLRPAYNFGGLSLTQMGKPYVDNFLRTRQAVADLVVSFTVFNLGTNLTSTLAGGTGEAEDTRIRTFTTMRDNRGLLVTDKDTETLTNISAPLSTLDALQAQAQEHQAAVFGIPLIKLLGISPAGLNASSEGELRCFYDTISARQERLYTEPLTTVIQAIQLDLFGEIDPDITFDFVPLWQLDETAQAALRKTEADTDAVLSELGAIGPEDVRKRIAADPDSPYHGLELNDLPERPDETDGGGLFDDMAKEMAVA